jgi:hypothetical protein
MISPSFDVLSLVCFARVSSLTRVAFLYFLKNHKLRVHATVAFKTLRTEECPACGSFAAFLFLPTFKRVCFLRLQYNEGLRAITTQNLERALFLSGGDLQRGTVEMLSISFSETTATTRNFVLLPIHASRCPLPD